MFIFMLTNRGGIVQMLIGILFSHFWFVFNFDSLFVFHVFSIFLFKYFLQEIFFLPRISSKLITKLFNSSCVNIFIFNFNIISCYFVSYFSVNEKKKIFWEKKFKYLEFWQKIKKFEQKIKEKILHSKKHEN